MPLTRPITFVAAVNNRQIFEDNLFASTCLWAANNHELVAQAGFASASLAYNDAMDRASNEVMVFAHQDVFFPPLWLSQLEAALAYLGNTDPRWGVLGCWGVTQKGERRGHIYSSGWGELGRPLEHPAEVQTLDEIVLILRKSSGLRFDERLRHFHLYGTDICMAAGQQGLRCYAIPAFCIHNTEQLLTLPQEFYECYRQIKRKWREHLPIHTSCIRISRFDLELYTEKLGALYRQIGRRKRPRAHRAANPQHLLRELEANFKTAAGSQRRPSMGRANRILGRILNRLHANPYTTAKLQKVVSEVRQEDHVLAQSLANALDAFEKKTISPEERLWIGRIESLRNELISTGEMDHRRSEARRIARTCKLGAMPPLWSLLLFKLVREFKPRKCLELGTSLGFSAAYQAAALEVNHLGSMVTIEGTESLAAVAKSNLQRLGLSRCVVKIGNFRDALQAALEDLAPLDFVFLDGDHEEHATLSYFERIVPFLSESALIVFDDISWSPGMARAWKVIAGDQRVKISVDLSKLGACVVTNHLKRKKSFNCELARWERGLAGIASPVACTAGDSA